jgi:hypothetical protein
VAARLLLDEGIFDDVALGDLARLALGTATPPADAAAWIAGVVRGNGLLLLQQTALWRALDFWLRELDPDHFTAALPLVRRAFADFAAPERRAMGDRVRRIGGDGSASRRNTADTLADIDRERADRLLPVLAQLLGVAAPRG